MELREIDIEGKTTFGDGRCRWLIMVDCWIGIVPPVPSPQNCALPASELEAGLQPTGQPRSSYPQVSRMSHDRAGAPCHTSTANQVRPIWFRNAHTTLWPLAKVSIAPLSPGTFTGGKNAFIQGLHGDYIVIF